MNFNRKLLWIAGAAAVVAAFAWAFTPSPPQVEVARVTQGLFEASIEEDGQTRFKDKYTISAPVAARAVRSTLREGDRVSQGATVAVLTPLMSPMIDERSSRELQARLQAATAAVERAHARVEKARVALDSAQLALQRDEQLARQGFVAALRLDTTRLERQAARRELEAATADQAVAAYERDVAQAALTPSAQRAGGTLAVRSPVSGVVLKVPQQSEATLAQGTTLLEVADPTQMEIVAEMLTTDAVKLQPGERAMIERWGGPPVQARVRRVEPAAFTKVSALGIEEQRVEVLFDIVDPPQVWERLGDGFRVGVRVITLSIPRAVQVPLGAVFAHEEGFALYVLDKDHARLETVNVGGRNNSHAWVREGLTPGQHVVVYPPASLADGARVAVRRP